MKWSVYRRTSLGLKNVGYVNASNKTVAIAHATKRWPRLSDRYQTQYGFHVVPYTRDSMSLGKLHDPNTARTLG